MDDVFRCVANRTGPHPDNILWLDGVLAPAIRHLGGSTIRLSSHAFAERRIDVAAVMADCGLTPGIGAWAQILEMDDTSVIGPWLRPHLADIDIVVGFELPNVLFAALSAMDLTVVDLIFSPIRFLDDLCLEARCNDPVLVDHLQAAAIPADEVVGAVAQISGTVRRRFGAVRQVAELGSAGVLLGQTLLDASLVENGRVVQLGDYADRVLAWAERFDTVILKPHPYYRAALRVPWLRRAGVRLVHTQTSPYQLFCFENVRGAAGISSGALTEAKWFGVPSEQFLTPPRARFAPGPVERVSSAVFTAAFWRAWLNGDAPPAAPQRLPSLRDQIGTGWGYARSFPKPSFRRAGRLPGWY